MKPALIFDLDGTLWDTTTQLRMILEKSLKSYDISLENMSIDSIMNMPYKEMQKEIFNDNYLITDLFIEDYLKNANDYLACHGRKYIS